MCMHECVLSGEGRSDMYIQLQAGTYEQDKHLNTSLAVNWTHILKCSINRGAFKLACRWYLANCMYMTPACVW